MKGKTTIIGIDGTETVTEHTAPIDLAFMQKAVGGYIEQVPMFNEFRGAFCVAMCNETGKIDKLPRNAKATEHWFAALNGDKINDYLVGPILIVQGDNEFIEAL